MINNEIRTIVDRFKASLHPEKIYLFGSYARDTFTDESDYDFYIVVNDSASAKTELSRQAYRSLRGMKRKAVDIIIGTVSQFEERKALPTLEKMIAKEGVVLYEK
ncbi:MAG: nucleotidyltransferase domain-containing protein [Treponema sp.]|nr:nucleotidyltransferase domain-containing protein [Treponema sp.]